MSNKDTIHVADVDWKFASCGLLNVDGKRQVVHLLLIGEFSPGMGLTMPIGKTTVSFNLPDVPSELPTKWP